MIYIHELKALNIKSAEIESVPIIRELKQKSRLPVSEEHMLQDFSGFMARESDINLMEQTAGLLPLTMQNILDFSRISSNAEQINLKRAYTDLQEIQEHLKANMEYARQIFVWQSAAMPQMAMLINKTTSLKTREDKAAFNGEVSPLFEIILRNKQFRFLFWDLIHEAHVERIKGIAQGVEEGVFFHFEVDEYTKKTSFSEIRKRLPQEELKLFDEIAGKISEIKKGVDIAYDLNKRMIGFAVYFYSYMRWLGGI